MLTLNGSCYRAANRRYFQSFPRPPLCNNERLAFPRSSTWRPSSLMAKYYGRFFASSVGAIKPNSAARPDDLPLHMSPAHVNPIFTEHEGPAYPPVVLQARSNMLKFENCVVLTRVGGFYELYFEHADEFGPLLNLKVAQKRTNAGLVSMAGFPFFQLERYLKILVQDLGRYVAVAEEFPNDAAAKIRSGGLLHDRKVSRVISPGTLIDETFIDPYASNYVLAIHMEQTQIMEASKRLESSAAIPSLAVMPIGLSWLDLSTGQFFTQRTTLSMLSSIISRVAPREIVVDEHLHSTFRNSDLFSVLAEDRHFITHYPSGGKIALIDWNSMLDRGLSDVEAACFSAEEISAGGYLLYYVERRLQGLDLKLQPPVRYQATETMIIDKSSMRALEIKSTIRDGQYRGSLSHAVRRTVTKGGTRLLDEWLSAPSTSLPLINHRLDLVSYMLTRRLFAERVVSLLRKSHDSIRLVQRFALGRGTPDDIIVLANTILATRELVTLLREAHSEAHLSERPDDTRCLAALLGRITLDGPSGLEDQIRSAIDEDGVVQQHRIDDSEVGMMLESAARDATVRDPSMDVRAVPKKSQRGKSTTTIKEHYANQGDVWIMKPAASNALWNLHVQLGELANEKVTLTESLRHRLGSPSLTLRWTPGLGHICHVKGKGKDTLDMTNLRSVSSSKSTRSFHEPEWTTLGQKTDQIKLQIRAEERRVFLKLREEVLLNVVKLRHNASVLDELDIACSFAKLAEEQSLVRPILNNTTSHKIVGGRHPTVQGGLLEHGRGFIRNDCFVGEGEKLWLITGPNMAGKSTFLRQNALITILAQVGSYVPAEYAEIGIVDRIFSRVGSADNLFRDQSTFMVEMLETAMILKHATPRSFVIMDEIGRGTTPEDGTAVAFACLHHLCHVNQCRTLFATHFHRVAELSRNVPGVGCYCTDVAEDKGGAFSYVHKLRKGVNRQSHALKVARIAGLPEAAITAAQDVLERAVP